MIRCFTRQCLYDPSLGFPRQSKPIYNPLTDWLQEMDSVESAQQIMETDLRYQFNLDGTPLRLDYSHGAQPAAAVSASVTSDWVCPGCSAVNFSRLVR